MTYCTGCRAIGVYEDGERRVCLFCAFVVSDSARSLTGDPIGGTPARSREVAVGLQPIPLPDADTLAARVMARSRQSEVKP